MSERKPKWDLLSEERKRECINKIISFFENQRNETIGVVAAQEVLDFFIEAIAEDVYNKAIDDAKKLVTERFENIEVDLDLLFNK
jgi:uncharacterized protein (DUF2164 family)